MKRQVIITNRPLSKRVPSSNFSPTDISDLKLWFQSDFGVTLDGSNVTGWSDRSGLNNNASIASGGPTVTSSALNGRDVLTFNGAQKIAHPVSINAAPATVFAVAKRTGTAGIGQMVVGASAPSAGMAAQLFMNYGGGELGGYFNGAVYTTRSALNRWGIFAEVESSAGAGGITFIDAGTKTVVNGNGYYSDATDRRYIGGYHDYEYFIGSIAEVLVFDRCLTSDEVNKIYAYLSSRHKLPVQYDRTNTASLGANWSSVDDANQTDTGGYLQNLTNNQSEVTWSTYLNAGTYNMTYTFVKNADRGIVEFYVDDTLIKTLDTYWPGGAYNATDTGTCTITTSGTKTIKMKGNGTRNGTSSNYYLLVESIRFTPA